MKQEKWDKLNKEFDSALDSEFGSVQAVFENAKLVLREHLLANKEQVAKDLQEILGIMLADNRHAWELQPDGSYIQRCPCDNCPEANSQKTIMSMTLRSVGIN